MIVLKDVLALLDGELLTPTTSPEAAFRKVFASDLMSDVLTSAEPGSLLLTGLANAHVVCTCSVADLSGVVFVQGKRPAPAVVDEAGDLRAGFEHGHLRGHEGDPPRPGLVEDGGHGRR